MNRCLLFLALSGLSLLAFSETKSTILWGVGNTPPRLTIDAKGHLGGQGGKQQLLLEDGLKSDYLHKHVPMTWARFEAEIEKGMQVCV